MENSYPCMGNYEEYGSRKKKKRKKERKEQGLFLVPWAPLETDRFQDFSALLFGRNGKVALFHLNIHESCQIEITLDASITANCIKSLARLLHLVLAAIVRRIV